MPVITGGEPPKRRKKERRGNPIRAQKAAESEFRRSITELNRELKTASQAISAQIRAGAGPAQIAAFIEQRLSRAGAAYDAAAQRLSENFVGKLSGDNKTRIEAMLRNTLGIDLVQVLDTDAIRDQLQLAIADNTRLIKSVPEQHFQKVAQAVSDNFRGAPLKEGSLTRELQKIGRLSDSRAKFIARDQTQKLVTGLNSIRQQEAGIEGYIWRNQGDNSVVGNPSGKYPKGNRAHNDHWHREGKMFKWNEPPPDGHPGQPIGCRCFAEPIINFEAIDKNAIRI